MPGHHTLPSVAHDRDRAAGHSALIYVWRTKVPRGSGSEMDSEMEGQGRKTTQPSLRRDCSGGAWNDSDDEGREFLLFSQATRIYAVLWKRPVSAGYCRASPTCSETGPAYITDNKVTPPGRGKPVVLPGCNTCNRKISVSSLKQVDAGVWLQDRSFLPGPTDRTSSCCSGPVDWTTGREKRGCRQQIELNRVAIIIDRAAVAVGLWEKLLQTMKW